MSGNLSIPSSGRPRVNMRTLRSLTKSKSVKRQKKEADKQVDVVQNDIIDKDKDKDDAKDEVVELDHDGITEAWEKILQDNAKR